MHEKTVAVCSFRVAVHAFGLISVFVQLSSWGMVIVGCGYFLMGLLCLRGLKDRVEEDYRRFGGAAHQC